MAASGRALGQYYRRAALSADLDVFSFFQSGVCGVRVVCCGVAVDVVCSSRVPASLDAVPPRRVVIAAEWHMKLAIAASEHAPEPALRALSNELAGPTARQNANRRFSVCCVE